MPTDIETDWSAPVSFSLRLKPYAYLETQNFTNTSVGVSGMLGVPILMDGSATFALLYHTQSPRGLSVFKRVNHYWTKQPDLPVPIDPGTGSPISTFGQYSTLSRDGKVLVTALPPMNNQRRLAILTGSGDGSFSFDPATGYIVDSASDETFQSTPYVATDHSGRLIYTTSRNSATGATVVAKWQRQGATWARVDSHTFPLTESGTSVNWYLLACDGGGDRIFVRKWKGGVAVIQVIDTLNGWTVQSTIESTAAGDTNFGSGFAVNEGGSIAFVGSSGGINNRAVLVYTFNGAAWVQQDYLIPSKGLGDFQLFGAAIALSGDGLSALITNGDYFGELYGIYAFD